VPGGLAGALLPAGTETLLVPAPPAFAFDDEGESEHAANSNSAAAQVMRCRVIASLDSTARRNNLRRGSAHFVTWLD
jgi:hypothetical protein